MPNREDRHGVVVSPTPPEGVHPYEMGLGDYAVIVGGAGSSSLVGQVVTRIYPIAEESRASFVLASNPRMAWYGRDRKDCPRWTVRILKPGETFTITITA